MGRHLRGSPKLSPDFLREFRGRLDAIGDWEVDGTSDNLWIRWAEPVGLSAPWSPFPVAFHTDSDSPSLDPDARMFELYEHFLRHHAAALADLADRVAAERGAVDAASVEVSRQRQRREDVYTLRANFLDPTMHSFHYPYNKRPGRFGPMEA